MTGENCSDSPVLSRDASGDTDSPTNVARESLSSGSGALLEGFDDFEGADLVSHGVLRDVEHPGRSGLVPVAVFQRLLNNSLFILRQDLLEGLAD